MQFPGEHPVTFRLFLQQSDSGVLKEILDQLPKLVSDAVDRYMSSRSAEIKVDEASVKSVKNKITELLSGLFR